MVVVNDQVPGTSSGISPSRPKGILGVDLPCEGPLAEPPGSGPDPALVYPPDTTCDVEVRDEEATPCVGVGTRASEVGGAECDKRVSWGAMVRMDGIDTVVEGLLLIVFVKLFLYAA